MSWPAVLPCQHFQRLVFDGRLPEDVLEWWPAQGGAPLRLDSEDASVTEDELRDTKTVFPLPKDFPAGRLHFLRFLVHPDTASQALAVSLTCKQGSIEWLCSDGVCEVDAAQRPIPLPSRTLPSPSPLPPRQFPFWRLLWPQPWPRRNCTQAGDLIATEGIAAVEWRVADGPTRRIPLSQSYERSKGELPPDWPRAAGQKIQVRLVPAPGTSIGPRKSRLDLSLRCADRSGDHIEWSCAGPACVTTLSRTPEEKWPLPPPYLAPAARFSKLGTLIEDERPLRGEKRPALDQLARAMVTEAAEIVAPACAGRCAPGPETVGRAARALLAVPWHLAKAEQKDLHQDDSYEWDSVLRARYDAGTLSLSLSCLRQDDHYGGKLDRCDRCEASLLQGGRLVGKYISNTDIYEHQAYRGARVRRSQGNTQRIELPDGGAVVFSTSDSSELGPHQSVDISGSALPLR